MVAQKSCELFLNDPITVNTLNLIMLSVLYESVANGLSKTGLNLKIGQIVPKL